MVHAPTDVVIENCRVAAMDPAVSSTSSTVVVRDGRIHSVGEAGHEGEGMGYRVDAGGRWLLPGFIDAHHHLSIAAGLPRWADLSRVSTLEELGAALVAQAAAEPDHPWIRGAKWRGAFPVDREILDEFGLDRPIMVGGVSCHDGIVDSRGLDLLGITDHAPDPRNGRYGRDDQGRVTGELFEAAFGPAFQASNAFFTDEETFAELIVQHAASLLREGVTAIHDAACSPVAERVYQRLAEERRLPVSVLAMPHAAAMFTDNADRRRSGPRTGEGDEWFRVGAVKFFADGGRLPAFSSHDGHGHSGLLNVDLTTAVADAVRHGYRVAVHAVGDAAMDATLEALTEAHRLRPDQDHRSRIEHSFFTNPDHIRTMAAQDVIASVQPGVYDILTGYFDSHGPHIAPHMFRFADLAEAGVMIAASSDDPCAPFGPLTTSAPAALRRTTQASHGEQRIPMTDWLRAYTIGAAMAGGQEHERGSITPGKRADLVLLDGELDADIPPRVAETWVEGERVWTATDTATSLRRTP